MVLNRRIFIFSGQTLNGLHLPLVILKQLTSALILKYPFVLSSMVILNFLMELVLLSSAKMAKQT